MAVETLKKQMKIFSLIYPGSFSCDIKKDQKFSQQWEV